MSFEERQDLLRLVVDNVTVENETVKVDTIIPSADSDNQLRTRRGELVEPLLGVSASPCARLARVLRQAQDERNQGSSFGK